MTLRSLAAFLGKETRVSQTATKRSGNAGNKTYPRELKNLGGKVLQHGSDVDSCLRADAHLILGVLLEEALHTAARELKDWGLATVRVWRNKRWRAGPPPPLPRCANSVPRGRQTRWTGQHSRSWADVGGANLGLRWLGTTPVLRNGSETRAGRVALQGIEKRHRCAGRRDGSAMLFRRGERKKDSSTTRHTCKPARAEWLCCFLGPSTPEVLPPELLPPEDLPFPPAIVATRAARGDKAWEKKSGWGKKGGGKMARSDARFRC